MEKDKDIVTSAENFVKKSMHGVTTSQIRKFLSAVNKLENQVNTEKDQLPQDIANEIKYLKIKLAYQTGRNKNLEVLYQDFSPKIDTIGNSKKKFNEFARYIEAIVAYHKFYGGKD